MPSPVLPVKTGISWWNDDVMPSSDLPEETDIFIFLWRNAVCWYPIEDWHCWNFDDVFPVLRFSTEDRIIIYFCDVMPSPGTPLKTELWWRIPVLTGRREDRQRRGMTFCLPPMLRDLGSGECWKPVLKWLSGVWFITVSVCFVTIPSLWQTMRTVAVN
jgi:hypothetical protein